MGLKRQKGLVVAIDTVGKKDYEKLKGIISTVSDLSADIIFKPGLPTALSYGFNEFMNFLQRYDNKIIFDAKLAEDGEENSEEKSIEILNMCKKRKLDGMIVHGFIDKDIIRHLVETSGSTDIIAVVKMSSKSPVYDKHYRQIAETSVNCGVKGVVVGATLPKYIKEIRSIVDRIKDSTYICSPGIGYQGGNARVVLQRGTDYLIVGRDILQADNPREKTREYLDDLKS